MLTSLSLRDFVIVESLSLDVRRGFTVLTGETGAGKSILIDALELILGGRGDAGVVREGAERADIVAEFSPSERADRWLKENELQSADETLLIRRTIDDKGRSRAWINGIAVTTTQLRDLGERLVDVHGQHAHQSLLKPAHQLKLLDSHAGTSELVRAVEKAYYAWQDARRALEDATANARSVEEKTERLTWIIEDLEALSPKPGEWETLTAEHTRLAHGVAISEGLTEILDRLTESDDSASSVLSSAHAKLTSLTRYDEKLAALGETLASAIDLVEEAGRGVSKYLDRTDLDADRFQKIDHRVGRYFNLARKFHTEPEHLGELLESYREELRSLTSSKDVEALARAEEQTRADYDDIARRLSEARSAGARELSAAVTAEMQHLAMKGARLEIALTPSEPSPAGSEKCEFLIAGHAGVQTRPLIKVASGGELARISLAIAVITAKATPVPTLIFDEVDSGIGGAVAEVVGTLLKQLGRDRQVLCITHLPQVASCGDNHWRVEKRLRNERTVSTLTVLDRDARVDEVARMLAGVSITQNTLALAREMIRSSKENE